MYKSKLQELCHQHAWSLPVYETNKEGPDHNPRFSSSITVNGVAFQTPTGQCRSSKEAQNEAAKLAFEHLTALQSVYQQPHAPNALQSKPPINSLPSASNAIIDTKAAKIGLMEQGNSPTLQAFETPLSFKEDKSSKEMLHLYKSRLQNYAQKRNLALPTYSCETMGPPHARRFKSKVSIDGKSYETSDFYTNLKDAEHAAAKVAFESMSLHETQEVEGLYKSLLQELAQKRGSRCPTYETDRSGPPHMPMFVSKVEIGGESFEGQQAKSKKVAEMNAAKAAYSALIGRRAEQLSTVFSPDFYNMAASEVQPFNLQPQMMDNVQPNVVERVDSEVVLETDGSKKEASEEVQNGRTLYSTVFSPDFHAMGALELPPFDLQPQIMEKVQSNVMEKVGEEVVRLNKDQAEEVENVVDTQGERQRKPSLSENGYTRLQSPTFSPPKDVPSTARSDMETYSGAQASAARRVLVCARIPHLTVPEGATVLPISDNEWLAVKLEVSHKQ